MSAVNSVQFTQDQARTLTGVSAETVRHWKKAIPYLSAKTGKAARFTFADVLGLAVIHQMVNLFGVHIAVMCTGVDALLHLLTASDPNVQDRAIVFLTSTEANLHEASIDGIGQSPLKPALMIPPAPLIANIHRQMLPAMPASSQTAFPFPVATVRGST